MSAVEGHESDVSVPKPTSDQTAAEVSVPDEATEGAPEPASGSHAIDVPETEPEPASGSHAIDVPETEPEPPQQSPHDYLRFDCTTGDPTELAAATEAARVSIERGECIVLPTDTVYGIGADAFSAEAVQRLLDAKIRGRDMPPPVLIADPGLIRVLAIEVPQTAKDLVAKHWPGPLTVILKVQPSLRLDLGEAEGTIALRVPDHDLAREVLRQTGPMAVSSANISGLTATLTVDDAIEQLDDRVSVYLDGGPLGTGDPVPSTMVDFSQRDEGEVLRHGALSVAVLRETLPELDDLVEDDVVESSTDDESPPESDEQAEPDGLVDGSDDTLEHDGDNGDSAPSDDDEQDPADTEPVDEPEADGIEDPQHREAEEFYLEDPDEAKADRRILSSDIQRRSQPEA